jgi:acyl-CoA thioesterase FadM
MEDTVVHEIEKRRFPRVNQTLPITLHLDGYPEQAALCKNISEGGVYVEIPDVSVGEHLSVLCNKYAKLWVKIFLEKGAEQVEALAVTRWTKSMHKDNKYGIGMEFIELPPSQRNRLSSYLKEKIALPPEKFIYKTKAYLGDVNVFGTAYFARYFAWQGEAREDFFQLVPGHERLMTLGLVLVTKSASIEYIQSVRLFDDVIIEVTTDNVKKLSFELVFRYYIKRLLDDPKTKGLAAVAREKICFVKNSEITGEPEVIPVPEPIRQTALLTLDQSKK